MNVEYHKWYSPVLNQDMELKVYGDGGKPVLVFPAQGGRFFEYEDFGMVNAVSGFIDSGRIQLFTVDSVDNQSWANWNVHPATRGHRHEDYDRYIIQEVVPFIRYKNSGERKILTTGCSMGGYHSGNFFFRHPDVFDGVIALSGLFQLRLFVGNHFDDTIYFNSPIHFLPELEDAWFLDQYRQSRIVICTGQGAWEEDMVADARKMQEILSSKEIPAWVDFWGHDVNHDWPWWRRQLPYFLEKMDL